MIFNKSLFEVTRRAGKLILDSKSNTVSAQIVSERVCDILVTFTLKFQFLIKLDPEDFSENLFFENYFSGTLNCSGGHELGPGAAYRFYQGQNPGRSFKQFSKKNEKSEKNNF